VSVQEQAAEEAAEEAAEAVQEEAAEEAAAVDGEAAEAAAEEAVEEVGAPFRVVDSMRRTERPRAPAASQGDSQRALLAVQRLRAGVGWIVVVRAVHGGSDTAAGCGDDGVRRRRRRR
jgi:hypothetical protein